MTAKQFSNYEIERQLTWLDNSNKSPEHDFSIVAGIIKQLQARVKELESQVLMHEERYQILKDLENQGFQMVQTLERERDEARRFASKFTSGKKPWESTGEGGA